MPQQILNLSQWETRVHDVFSMARICKMTQAQIHESVQSQIYDELHRKHGGKRAVYSAYVHGFVSGLLRAEQNTIMRNDVEFCYLVDGVLFSTHKDTDKRQTEEFYARDAGSELSNAPSGFVWKGTVKPYFGFEPKA